MRLLIIDDNQDAARGMELYLRSRFQHELRVAHDGRSGVSTAAEFVPDVVLLDIGLPDMDGYEVARRLRGHPALCRVPLIAITGFGDELHRSRAKEAGIDHFLVKPVAYPELEDLLADCAASGVGD
jgi:DNA-binding response OmpR family regulator